jgi:hypothetical protein
MGSGLTKNKKLFRGTDSSFEIVHFINNLHRDANSKFGNLEYLQLWLPHPSRCQSAYPLLVFNTFLLAP